MPHKPLLLDPKVLRPLPGALWDLSCEECDKRQARWELTQPDLILSIANPRKGVPICSLCWLYETDWGKERREDIDRMIVDVEAEVGREFKRAEDGRLLDCQDANRIVASVAVTSRVFNTRSMLQRVQEDG